MMGMMDPKFYAPEFIAKFKSSNFTIQDVDEFAEKYKKFELLLNASDC